MAAAYVALTIIVNLPLRLVGRWLGAGVENEPLDAVAWLIERAPELLTSAVGGFLLGWIPYAILKRSPRHWWMWGSAGALLAVLAFLVAEPWMTAYRPIIATDLPFTDSIIGTSSRAGIPATAIGVRQGDGTTCGAGGVIGLGPTRLLLLDDNLITAHTEQQVLSTVGHEAKHFALDDNRTGFLILCILIPAVFLAVRFLAQAMLARWSATFGFREFTSPAALPLLAFCFALVMLAITPVWTQVYRHVEIEADRFGLEMIKQNAAYADMLAREQSCYKLDPEEGWFRRFFRNNHPAVGVRIRFANGYRPWERAQPLTYEAHFRPDDTRP
jgi:STE24 endopeptidase